MALTIEAVLQDPWTHPAVAATKYYFSWYLFLDTGKGQSGKVIRK